MDIQTERLAGRTKGASIRKLACVSVLAAASAGLLGGCGQRQIQEWVPTQTTLVVNEDGTLTETIMETLDRDYYSADALKTMVDQSVSEYNAERGAEPVRVDSYQAEGNKVTLVMTYLTGADYAAYNNVAFFNGTMLGAQMEGFRFETEFYAVKDGAITPSPIGSDVPLSHKEARVLITDASHAVRVPGDIMYVSTLAQTADEHTAVPADSVAAQTQAQPDVQILQDDTDAPQALEAGSSEVYIIYE